MSWYQKAQQVVKVILKYINALVRRYQRGKKQMTEKPQTKQDRDAVLRAKKAARSKQYYRDNKEMIAAKRAALSPEQKQKHAAYDKKYFQEHKDQINAYRRSRYQNLSPEQKAAHLATAAQWRAKNKKHIAAQARKNYYLRKQRSAPKK